MNSWIDSHTHLDLILNPDDNNCNKTQPPSLSSICEDAASNNVSGLLNISVELEAMPRLIDYSNKAKLIKIWNSIGVHPTHHFGVDYSLKDFEPYENDSSIIAVGETGLDYYHYNNEDNDMSWQRRRFETHIELAKKIKKPLIIHTRAAKEDTLDFLKQNNASDVGGVMHCFVEDWETAKKALDMDFYISFSGIITFKNANEIRDVAKKVPLDRLLVETDAPYLAPVPKRGKANFPAYVAYTGEYMAGLRGLNVEECMNITTDNFIRLFSVDINKH